jgi:hypothetical protein
MSSVEHISCGICHEDVVEVGEAKTGVLRTSCGHTYHPTCLWKWYSTNHANTCPVCRAPAKESEAVTRSDSEEEEQDFFDDNDTIHITRVGMEEAIGRLGGLGLSARVESELDFDQYGETLVTRYEFERILAEQGVGPISNIQWNHLLSVYPVPSGTAPVIPAAVYDVIHAPGPFDFPDSPTEIQHNSPPVVETELRGTNLLMVFAGSFLMLHCAMI